MERQKYGNLLQSIDLHTNFIGQNYIYKSELNSTNNYLLELLAANNGKIADGTVVFTDFQRNGKGQQGAFWESERNANLLFSIYFDVKLNLSTEVFTLNKLISIAITNVLQSYLYVEKQNKLKIKWPNDILIGEEKVCGILIETKVKKGLADGIVVGIGLNINQVIFEGTKGATSLHIEGEKFFNRKEILPKILLEIEKYYLQGINQKNKSIDTTYLNHLFGYNEIREFEIKAQKVQGKIIDVNEKGQLEVLIKGSVQEFATKEINFLLKPQ
ncbi:MAG: BirA family biotin operon repressor/biotin-[acetyl-CoA-carboxylase] ligase [Sphingobacteriales bacterium]